MDLDLWGYIVWCFKNEEFNVFKQLFLPFLSGVAGGYASTKIMELDYEYEELTSGEEYLYIFLGGLAGWLAVNLLNPSGTIAQVLVLGFVAGLSGVTYLKRNALVEGLEEKRMFGEEKRKFLAQYEKVDVLGGVVAFDSEFFKMTEAEKADIMREIEEEDEKSGK